MAGNEDIALCRDAVGTLHARSHVPMENGHPHFLQTKWSGRSRFNHDCHDPVVVFQIGQRAHTTLRPGEARNRRDFARPLVSREAMQARGAFVCHDGRLEDSNR
jgi:hypothetical protein